MNLTSLIGFHGVSFSVRTVDLVHEVNSIVLNAESFYEFIIGIATTLKLSVDADFIMEFSSCMHNNVICSPYVVEPEHNTTDRIMKTLRRPK